MKAYKRKTEIMAEPMTMGEAYGTEYLETGSLPPSEIDDEKKGYAVECDGVRFWIDKETFEENYVIANTFLDRLHIEHDELKTRFDKLSNYVKRKGIENVAKDIGLYNTTLLLLQCQLMQNYLEVLTDRMENIK